MMVERLKVCLSTSNRNWPTHNCMGIDKTAPIYITRSKLVPLLAGNHSFQEQHERRWGALYVRMMHSENILVQYMARRSMYNVLGTLGTNRVVLVRNPCVQGLN